MKNQNPLTPTCTARVSTRTTKDGKQLMLVSVVTPDDVAFRTYEHIQGNETERAIANALRSLGLPSAWVWGSLTPGKRLERKQQPETRTKKQA